MKKITISARSRWSIIITLAIFGIAYITAIKYIIPGLEKIVNLPKGKITINDLILIWIPIANYLLVGTFVCMVVQIFKKLKPYKKEGLIWGFIKSFKLFCILSLGGPIIIGIMGYLLEDLKGGIIYGSIIGFTVGLSMGIIFGIIMGISEELNK